MKKQIITVLVLGAIAAMPFSAAVSAAESAQWRKYTTRAKQRAAEEAAAKEEKDKEAALARQKAEEVLSNDFQRASVETLYEPRQSGTRSACGKRPDWRSPWNFNRRRGCT